MKGLNVVGLLWTLSLPESDMKSHMKAIRMKNIVGIVCDEGG